MLQVVSEDLYLWNYLSKSTKPVIIYGMGDGADKILIKCNKHNIPVQGIFASDNFVRGQSFHGHKVVRYQDVINIYGNNIIILLAFGSENPQMLEHFSQLAERHEFFAPNLPLFGQMEFTPDFFHNHARAFKRVYDLLADEHSRQVLQEVVNYKLTGKISYLRKISSCRQQDYCQLLNVASRQTYLDLGAYDGDTVREFLQLTAGNFQKIIALEPDAKNFKKLSKWKEAANLENIDIYPYGAWSESTQLNFDKSGSRSSHLHDLGKEHITVRSIDDLLQNQPISLIKIDVEGAEYQTLLGGKNILKNHRPALLVACYHREEDLFELPLLLHQLNPEYKLYLRKHPYVPAWEINIFAV